VPLRLRLAVVFAAATATVLAVAGLVLLHQLQRSLDESVHGRLQVREGVLARLVQTNTDQLRAAAARRGLIQSPFGERSDQLAQIFTPDGSLALSVEARGNEPVITPGQLEQARRRAIEFRSHPGSPADGDLVRATPVAGDGTGTWVVAVGADLKGADAVVNRTRTGLLLAGPVAIGLSALGAWLLAGATLRPVEQLRREAAEISAHDTGASIQVPGTRDEIAALAGTMDDLLQRMQAALAVQRRFVADAGHELRTPLTVLRAELELAARPGRSVEDLQQAVAFAAIEADRLIRLAEDLLLLARADEGQPLLRPSWTSLREVLAAAVHAAAGRARPDVRVLLDAPDVTAYADPDRLRQAVDNLLDNALRFAPAGSEITVSMRHEDAPNEPRAVIEVADRGPGFPPEYFSHAFGRFQRADAARAREGGGSGLGLAIVRSLMRAHGGDASAANREAGGAVVRLELPLAAAPATAAP
jgi:heavy metal sensor kinase